MCNICNGMTYEEDLALTRKMINQFGWAISGIEGAIDDEGVHPAFAYTVGFTRHGLPEVLISGRTTPEAHEVLNQLGRDITRGLRLIPEIRLTVAGLDLLLLPVPTPERVLLTAGNVYGSRTIAALQAVWADADGLLPWEQEIPDDLTQPLYCQLPEHWFYCHEHQPPQ